MNVNIIGVQEYNNKYLNMLSESVFISFINVYTRLPKGVNRSCLDHIFINGDDNVTSKINAGIILTDITDHCMVCVSIPSNANFVNNRKMFNKIDYKSITSILANENWTEVYDAYNDVNHCYNVFDKIIKNAIDKSTTRIILRLKNIHLKEWMINGLLTSARRKQFLSMKSKKYPNNLTLALHYKEYKNNLTKTIRLAKNNFNEQIFKNASSNPKST